MEKSNSLMTFIRENGGTARFSSIIEAGFHPDTLRKLINLNLIEKIGHGLYKASDYEINSHPDFVYASLQVPRGVICLVSALSFYGVTDEIPGFVYMAIPKGSHSNKVKFPPIKFFRYGYDSWKAGVENHEIDGRIVEIFNLAKTIADLYKFRNKIGANIALSALKISIEEKRVKPLDIMKYAKICRVEKIVKPIIESII